MSTVPAADASARTNLTTAPTMRAALTEAFVNDDAGRHADDFEPFEATHEEARAYSHGYRDGLATGMRAQNTEQTP